MKISAGGGLNVKAHEATKNIVRNSEIIVVWLSVI